MFFQQLKRLYIKLYEEKPSSDTSFLLGAIAASGGVCVMIPIDTVKTRLVLQCVGGNKKFYNGVFDCFYKIFREEGLGAFYISLLPRLVSVVPMISIQFGIYEIIKVKDLNIIYYNLLLFYIKII